MKKKIVFIIIVLIVLLINVPVKATESMQTTIETSNSEIKSNEEIEIVFSFKNYQEINNGINAYKATLEYDTNVFEEVGIQDFECLNSWEEFLYNSDNHQFIAIKKVGSKTDEAFVKLKLKAKDNIKAGTTIVKIKDIVTSEGKVDIKVDDSEKTIKLIETQNSDNNSEKNENINNIEENNKNEVQIGKLPYTGLSPLSSFILIAIEILILIAIIILIKMKIIDIKMNKKGKILLIIVVVGIISIQSIGTIYAIAEKGELNDDGQINYKDVSLLEQHLINLNKLPEEKLENADINSDNKITVTDLTLLVRKIEKTLIYKVNIISNMDNYYPNKNEEIELKFIATVSYDAKIEEVTINGQNYKVENEQGTTNYSVKIKTQNESGIQEFKFTNAKLNVGKEVKIEYIEKVDVLKEKPSIENYKVTEITDKASLKVSFNVIDNDKSITSAKMELSEKKDDNNLNNIKEEYIKVGENEFILELEEDKEYVLNIYLNYNLDTDNLKEHEKDNTGVLVETKKIKFAIDYKFTFNNLKLYNEKNVETQEFSKNEPIILGFTSTNATDFSPISIKVNGKSYPVSKTENNTYQAKIDSIEQIGEYEIKVEEVTLENGKNIIIESNNITKAKIQKERPQVQNVKIEEQNGKIKVSLKIKDTDNTISNKKIVIKNENGDIIFQKEIMDNEYNEECEIPDELTTEYKIEILADYDITTDGTGELQNQIIYTQNIKAKTKVKIENTTLSKNQLEKNENLTVTYKILTNKTEDIEKLIVNNIETKVTKNKDNTYSITISAGENAGKKEVELTKVIFKDGTAIDTNNIVNIEVLKTAPIIDNYQAEDDYDNQKVKFKFELIDEDGSFLNGKVQLVQKSDGKVKDERDILQKGELYFEIPVEEKEEYTFKIIATYTRNEDKTIVLNNQILLEKPIQMIVNYDLKINNIKTQKETSNYITKYFNRDEKIKIIFESTNVTKFVPEKVQINGKQYEVINLQNNMYETVIDGISNVGISEIKIEKLWMNNTKELNIEKNNTINVEILKIAPTVEKLEYEETFNNQLKITFEILDNENTISKAKIIVTDKNGTVYEKEGLLKGENEIVFDLTLSEEYFVKILADYDLDSNALETGANEYKNEEIKNTNIQISKELIELKDIKSVQIFTKNGNEIEQLNEIDINKFEPSNYIAKITMEQLPVFYAEIEEGVVDGKDFKLRLKYDNSVQYDGDKKSNIIEVKFGEIDNGIATNLGFDELIRKVQENPTGVITLTSDLDAKAIINSTATYLGDFKGIINGNGHVIKNLSKPLFNKLESAKIENLIIQDSALSGNSRGIIANQAIGTEITNVHIKDSSINTWNSNGTGGFIGTGENNTKIEYCSANNLKVSGYKVVGGFAGYYMSGSTINNCYIKGTVTGGYDAVGGMIGQTSSGDITLKNSYVDIQFNMSVAWAEGGLVGYSAGNTILINNISLARGNLGNRIHGSSSKYNNKSNNNYEIKESGLVSDANGNKVITISENDITSEFLENVLGLDKNIWRLENTNSGDMPTLKNLDPTDEANLKGIVKPDNSNVYIPDIERLRKMSNYNTEMEIAYHNMNLLMPFYDAKYYVQYGNKIDKDDLLNQSKIKTIIPYDNSNNLIVGLNTNNYNKISKIKIIFEDEKTKEYTLEFKKKLSDVSTYKIKELDIGYTYNQFILNTNISVVQEILNKVKDLDYKTQIQLVTPEDESRLYVDYYNESVKNNIDNVMLYVMSNEPNYNVYLENDILEQKIKQDITKDSQLEKIIYAYNYFDKWYHFEIGGISFSDLIFLNVHNINKEKTITNLVNATISQQQGIRSTNNTVGFYNNVIKSELGNKNLGEFLEYFIKILAEYDNGNEWFENNFKGILNEKPAIDKEDTIRYKAWDLLKVRNHLLLPVLSAPQEDMYIISVPSQIVIGSMNRYGQHISGNVEGMKKLVDDYATMIGNFYGISSTFINNADNILNSHVHIQYDTRFNFPESGNQNSGTTEDPVIKWVYEAIGSMAAQNGSGAYANGTDVYWVAYHALGSEFSFSVFSHETAHNQDGYYFYEGYGRRANTGAEDHADSNIAQDLGDGSLVFNIRNDISVTSDYSNNLKLDRISGADKIFSYYKEMFETYYVLDYLTGQAFLQLTPEEQSKVAVQVSYENGTDYEKGGLSTIYSKISAEEFKKMNLNSMEDLWDNGIALRGSGKVSGNMPGSYGGDNHYSIYWYQPHNNSGRPDSYSFKRLGFEMLGVSGYSDGYVTYRSGKSSNDLDALRKITKDDTITWKKYKMNRYEEVKANLNKIPYFNPQEIIELYKQALQKDAQNGNRNNTNNLRKLLYGVVKRATQDFTTGTIYSSGTEIEISSAEQFIKILNSSEWGNYKLTNDLDFSNIKTTDNTYISKVFVGRINGNGYKIKGLTKTLFNEVIYGEIQNVVIESPTYNSEIFAILTNNSKNIILNNVIVNNSNINLPFVKNNNGIIQWLGNTAINVRINEIKTIEDLMEIANSQNSIAKKMNYKLLNDIDLSSITNVEAIIPGTFEGTIYGNGHNIYNLKAPLFNILTGTVSDLNIENVEIIKSGTNNMGSVAGQTKNAILNNIKVNNVSIEGRDNISAIVGLSNATTYNKISATNINIKATHYYAGGMIGRSFDSKIKDVLISGRLEVRDTHNGGVIGALNRDTLENIYADVDVVRTSIGDSRNKNAGLYGAIETEPINVKNIVVVGNMSDTLYKITPGTNESEINQIEKYLVNVYEYEKSTGISNSEKSKVIQKVTETELKDINFYINKLGWTTDIWDLSGITFGTGPKLKK